MTVSVTNTFVAGTNAVAAEVNTNFTDITTYINNAEAAVTRTFTGTGGQVVTWDNPTSNVYRVRVGSTEIISADAGTGVVSLHGRLLLEDTAGTNNIVLANPLSGSVVVGTFPPSMAGVGNTLVGVDAGVSITSGTGNVAIGWGTGDAITEGTLNVLAGRATGSALTLGDGNVAVGNAALDAATVADSCVAVGRRSLLLAQGNGNIGLGFEAGANITSGQRNMALGFETDVPDATADDQLVIGSNGSVLISGVLHGTQTLAFFGATPVTRPEVPASPTVQDLVDDLVLLGLITQAA